MNLRTPLVIGYPRTGFSLLISVLAEVESCVNFTGESCRQSIKSFCDTAGMLLSSHIESVFQRRGLSSELLYNYNFRQLVGGPKWLKDGDANTACFRKYIGVKGKGDFTLITSHPRQVLDYYEIIHSHVAPGLWVAQDAYKEHLLFSSIRHPAGTLASACFSLNALASEYIQKFVKPEDDNDLLRQKLALYKLSDLNFFEALLGPYKSYLEEFSRYSDQYITMRWEDLIQSPKQTILELAGKMGVYLDQQQANDIWMKIDHINLTGAHKHNLRRGHGIVGGWRRWLTNTHLDMMRDYGLDKYSKRWGYGSIGYLDESAFTPFQEQIKNAISNRNIIREYDDEDLFGFAFNKSNLDLDRFDFKRYNWRTHTRIERSSCAEDDLVMEVWDVAESACEAINCAFGHLLSSLDDSCNLDTRDIIENMTQAVEPLFTDIAKLSTWRSAMFNAVRHDKLEKGKVGVSTDIVKEFLQSSEPVLLKSVGATNIVEYDGCFYALPQSLGPIDFHTQDVIEMPGVIFADSLVEIETAVAKYYNVI